MISIENQNPGMETGIGRKKLIFILLIISLFISSTIFITNTQEIKLQSGVK